MARGSGGSDEARLSRRPRTLAREGHADSWYAATAGELPRRPALRGSDRARVCVVGGGLTGLGLALSLAERGIDSVVLEANRVGWGASGRNGGHICTHLSCSPERPASAVGTEGARRLLEITEAAKARIERRDREHAMGSELRWGYYNGCQGPRQMRHAAEALAAYRRLGYEKLRLVETREESRRFVGTDSYVGGLVDEGAGHMHPLRHCLGLAAAAEKMGARVHEDSPVIGWKALDGRAASRFQVETDGGTVVCDHLALACNAYLGLDVPALRARSMPIYSYVAATEPLGEARAREMMPFGGAAITYKNLGEYYRMTSDHRLLFGARAHYSGRESRKDPAAMMARNFTRLFPGLRGAKVDYAWSGRLAVTMRREPHVGRLRGGGRAREGVFHAHGYSGQGVLLSQAASEAVAGAVAEDAGAGGDSARGGGGAAGGAADLALFERLPAPRFPGGRALRAPLLALAGNWYRIDDLLK